MNVRTDIVDSMVGGDHVNNLFGTATWVVQMLYTLVMIGATVALIINIAKLAMSAGNPAARSEALRNIMIAGGCLAVLGGIGLIFYLLLVII